MAQVHPERFVNVASARLQFGPRIERLGGFLQVGDPLADAVVESLETTPGGWGLFTQALAEGIDRVPGAPAAFRPFFDEVETVPLWFDEGLARRGGEMLLRAGPLGGLVLGTRSLPLGYTSPGGNKPLVFSGRLQEQVRRRLSETSRFVYETCKGGLARFGTAYQITLRVRVMHAQVRRLILRSGRWEAQKWGLPVNQHDMSGTALLFSIVVVDGLRQLGVRLQREEAEAYLQLWRYSSHLMGVDPELQVGSEAEGFRLAAMIEATSGQPDEDSRALTRALFDAEVASATSPGERRMAERRREVGRAVAHELLGDKVARGLGIPSSSYRLAIPVLRRLVGGVELVARRLPFGDRQAVAAGCRYWEHAIALGLAGATADFVLPERLRRAA